MKRHMTLHFPHDAPKYHCDICQKSFSRKHYAKIHRLNVHGLLNNLDESGTTFDLERKTPRCRLCQRTFYNSSSLRRHMQRHLANNRQRFPCGVCSKEFTRKDYVREHRMNVHGMPT
ncbi:zinc finger protein sdz-12-like [Dermacentor andersoni]|uniref:zinc finger protein sdz-12-like n=1 Tax=Dermacentor andersoni TaxID=34620 RepID=UPI003B3A0E6F